MSSETAPNLVHQRPAPEDASKRSHLRSLTGVQVVATGSYVPDQVVTNDDLAKLGYDSDWIVQRTGILARRKLPEGLATSDMAVAAAERCLESAPIDRSEIDLVLVGTMTPDRTVPASACLVQQRLGLTAAAMDMNAACAGFMYAFSTAAQFVRSGCSQNALVIGADTNTRIVNPEDPKTYPLFGDGAGAVLLTAGGSDQGLTAFTLGSEGTGPEVLGIFGGGSLEPLTPAAIDDGRQYISMDGRSVFKWAVRLVADAIRDVVMHAGLTLEDLSLVILHQANIRIIEAAADDLGIDRERLIINLDRYGNTSAGSIPLGLDEANRAGRIQRGDHLLLCGFGAGLAWGACVLNW